MRTSSKLMRQVAFRIEAIYRANLVAPEVNERYDGLGLGLRERYFAWRSAPMGRAAPAVVAAAFYNFHPALVDAALAHAWDRTTPEAVIAAQREGLALAYRRALRDVPGRELSEVVAGLRAAAEAASEHPEGRVLFAANAALGWPDDPYLLPWHTTVLLREFRGDGHIAALLAGGLSGVEALIVHGATDPRVPVDGFRRGRRWSDDEWTRALISLRERGWLEDGEQIVLSARGRLRREAIEEQTDELCRVAYDAIGDEGCEQLLERLVPIQQALRGAGLVGKAR